MKKLLLTTCLLLCLFILPSCGKKGFDEDGGTIIIGLECAYAPFNWAETTKTNTNVPVNNQKNLYAEGYDVMIARKIAESLGYELEIEMLSFDGLILALNSGKIDLIIAGMSPTETRKKQINFSESYYESNHVLLLDKNSSYVNAQTFSDLSGAKIMGQKSTIYDDLAKQTKEKNSSVAYQNPLSTVPEIVVAMGAGAVDITILEEPVAKGIIAAHPQYTYISLTESFDISYEDKVVSIGIRKADTDLLNKVNQALAKISNEERLAMMELAVSMQKE